MTTWIIIGTFAILAGEVLAAYLFARRDSGSRASAPDHDPYN